MVDHSHMDHGHMDHGGHDMPGMGGNKCNMNVRAYSLGSDPYYS